MTSSRFRIGYDDTIKAFGYNRGRRMVASVYDSGYTAIGQVIDRLEEKGSGFLTSIVQVNIVNVTKDKSVWLRKVGDRWVRE